MANVSVLKKEKCTGCGACYNICPIGAILMQENSEGFLYPEIDEDKCTNCGLCAKSCACLNPRYENRENPECYAFMASNEERMRSSSGAAFPVLVYEFIKNGGYVSGAVWNNDFGVEHIVSNNPEDIEKMRGSKYLQSDTKNCYKEIKELLNNAKKVLFTGCPCQVAGLKKYLQKDYANLFCTDIICHGVPSSKVFKKYIEEEILQNDDEKWINTSFRDKISGWNKYSITTKTTHTNLTMPSKNNLFMNAFLKDLCLRQSCAVCQFALLPRQGDITIGDFWGIKNFRKKYDDEKGTSLVLLNNQKGEVLSNILKEKSILYEPVPIQYAKTGNQCLIQSSIANKNRNLFFNLIDNKNLSDCLNYCKTDKTDYLVVNFWDSDFNYGACLTAYAMQELISEYGYVAKMLDTGERTNCAYYKNSWMEKFAQKYLNTTSQLDYKKSKKLSKSLKGVILGSDQVLRTSYTQKFIKKYLLDWVDRNTPKIAIAPSFGHYKNEWLKYKNLTKNQLKFIKNNLRSFKYLSCREKSGIEIYKDVFGLNSDVLLDPVFLLSKFKFENIANESDIDAKNKVVVYVLETKTENYISIKNQIKNNAEDVYEINRYHHTVNDWIKLIKDCKFFITDSFHGVCFALIFNKPFVYIENNIRGNSRFDNINELFSLDRFVYDKNKTIEEYLKVDYSVINQKIQNERIRCLDLCDKIFREDYSNNVVMETNSFFEKINFRYIKTYLNYKRVKFLAKYGKQKKLKHYIKKRDTLKNKLDWSLL